MQLAAKYLAPPSRGIEIGASAINPFPGLKAWNVDLPGPSLYQAAQEKLRGSAVRIDVGASGDQLPFADEALDYVLASHVIEHMPDPIRALGEWDRVVRVGGVVFLIVPHPERTADAGRPVTELRHLLADYALQRTAATDPLVPTSHYHVWMPQRFVELLLFLNEVGHLAWEILEVEPVDSKCGNGFTVVARKRKASTRAPGRPVGGAPDFFLMELALPFQTVRQAVQFVVPGPDFVAPEGAPRGTYRVHPIRAAFPPAAGSPFEVSVGARVAPPEMLGVSIAGNLARVTGRHLTETTWIEIEGQEGKVHRLLPRLAGDGALTVDITGVVLPTVPIRVRAHNLAPGGGSGPWFILTPEARAVLGRSAVG